MAQVATDKQQLEPMLEVLGGLPEALGSVEHLLADNGYFSAANVEHCVQAKIEPLLAAGRDGHHPHWEDRFTEQPPLNEPASAVRGEWSLVTMAWNIKRMAVMAG